MICVPLALVFGIIGIIQDQRKWLAFVMAAIALLLMTPYLAKLLYLIC